jgi:hypothetical protein
MLKYRAVGQLPQHFRDFCFALAWAKTVPRPAQRRWARLERKPFIGTCAGFQHAVLEFARNVLGFRDAMQAEYDPDASTLFIRPLSCSLVGKKWRSGLNREAVQQHFMEPLKLLNLTILTSVSTPEYRELLDSAGLIVSGWDDDQEVPPSSDPTTAEARVIELPDHPFFLATLFVPQTSRTRVYSCKGNDSTPQALLALLASGGGQWCRRRLKSPLKLKGGSEHERRASTHLPYLRK